MLSTLRAGYNSLQASTQPQSATSTIDKLCDRLLNSQQREDRRAALLAIKGLSRDWKSEVGSQALPILLGVLEDDAAEDTEMAKAVVETLSLLCEVEEVDGRPVRDDSGLRNSDAFLATPTPLHTLLTLLTPSHFYLRFFTLQLLGILLANRPQQVQQYVLTAAGGIGKLVETLSDSREIIRNESLLLLIALTTQNADIQKLMAFEGAFDKLFGIVRSEGGIGAGGIVVQDCLAAVAGLLRWNVSNQNYFRETTCIPMLAPLLLFPRPNALTPQSLATFAFQSWSEQKVINAGLVISIVRMLVGGAGGSGRSQNQEALLKTGLTRCLIEMALASNAPAILKAQSLNALADIMRSSPENQAMLTSLIITPLIPPAAPSSAESYNEEYGAENGEQPRSSMDGGRSDHGGEPERAALTRWQRGESVPAVVAVTNLAVNGDGTPGREGLRVRAAAANLFTSYVAGSTETQLGVLSTMLAPPPDAEHTMSSGSVILDALRTFPSSSRSDTFDSYVPFFACLLFSHLIMHSEVCKEVARKIYFQGDDTSPGGMGDEDDRITLVGVLVGNLMMAQREQAQSVNAGLGPERVLEWSRIMVGYLTSLCVWMWESPNTVKEFLSEGSNLQVLIQPITQSSGVDSVVQGLCTYLLGVCYEYNREPGPISRETLHPILQSRVGPDQFVSRILRLREDPRFRNVGPNVLELIDEDDALAEDLGEENGLWFDFSFVEFLKTNYISVQRSILVDPHASTAIPQSMSGISPDVLAALRASLAAQTAELDELRDTVRSLQQERDQERAAVETEFASMSDTILSLRQQLEAAQAAKADADREQEDLLVLLDDLNEKRSNDKRRMRAAQLEVSEDEDGGVEEDEEDEEDEVSLERVASQTGKADSPSLPAEVPTVDDLQARDDQQQHRPAAPEPPTSEEPAIRHPDGPGSPHDQQIAEGDAEDADPYRPQQSASQPPPTEEAPIFEMHDPHLPPQPDIPQTSGAYGFADSDPYNPFSPDASPSNAPQHEAESARFDAASSLFDAPHSAERVTDAFAPTADYEPAEESSSSLQPSDADKVVAATEVESSPAEQTTERASVLDAADAVVSPAAVPDRESLHNEPVPQGGQTDKLAATASASAEDAPERPTTPQAKPSPVARQTAKNYLRATPRRPPKDRDGRELIEPHVVDEEDFRPKSAAGNAAPPPPPPRASGPAPPPRSSAAPPPRATAKTAPRRAFFAAPGMSAQVTSPKQHPAMATPAFASDDSGLRSASPKSQGPSVPSLAATDEGSSSRLPEPSLFSPQSASHASPADPTGQTAASEKPSGDSTEKAEADVPQQEDSTATADADPRRTSIDDRLATAFFGGGEGHEDDSISGLFSGPTKDVSALFGGAFQAASRTAGSLFGSTQREASERRASIDSQRSSQRTREASAAENVPDNARGGPVGPPEGRSTSSLFGGEAPAASALFGGQQNELDSRASPRRQPESEPAAITQANQARGAPQPQPSRARPESQDVSTLFGGSAASLFGGTDDVAREKPTRNNDDPIEAPSFSNPYESAHSFFASHQREPSKPLQSGVRDVSSLFG